MFRLTDVVKNLLLLNVLFFAAVELDRMAGGVVGTWLANLIAPTFSARGQGFISLGEVLALHFPESSQFVPIQVATHFFLHGGLMHIFFNMFALAMFGPPLEALWGPRRFLIFYFVCAFGAAALYLLYNWYDFSQLQGVIDAFVANPTPQAFSEYFEEVPTEGLVMDNGQMASTAIVNTMTALQTNPSADTVASAAQMMQEWRQFKMDTPIVGASGAIYGVLLAFGMQYPDTKLMLIFPPIPIKARYFIPILMVIELFLGIQQYAWDNIAHFAHLGGAITGFLVILYWRKFGTPWRRE